MVKIKLKKTEDNIRASCIHEEATFIWGRYPCTESGSQILCHQTSNNNIHATGKVILKSIWMKNRPKVDKGNLRHKSNAEGITILDVQLYCRTIVTKTAWYWHESRHEDQWSRRHRDKSA